MRLLIATSKFPPTEADFRTICESIRGLAAEGQMVVPPGIIWTSGPGCTNLALDVEGGEDGEQERFANALTIALMPAKWSTTSDSLPTEDTFEL